jgi:hypothetical protein
VKAALYVDVGPDLHQVVVLTATCAGESVHDALFPLVAERLDAIGSGLRALAVALEFLLVAFARRIGSAHVYSPCVEERCATSSGRTGAFA